MRNIEMPLGEKRANAEDIIALLMCGALRITEHGICTGEQGVYRVDND